WWADLGARLLILSVIWMCVCVISLYGTALVIWASPQARTLWTSGWIVSVASGVIAAKSTKTGPAGSPNIFAEILARLTLPAFAVGVLICASLLVHTAVDNPPDMEMASAE